MHFEESTGSISLMNASTNAAPMLNMGAETFEENLDAAFNLLSQQHATAIRRVEVLRERRAKLFETPDTDGARGLALVDFKRVIEDEEENCSRLRQQCAALLDMRAAYLKTSARVSR